MKATLSPTDKIVELRADHRSDHLTARIWQGETEDGVPFHAYIIRVAVAEGRPEADYASFQESLKATAKMRPEIQAIDMRFII